MTEKIKTRPLSPHLSIYKPQISSILSIMHRISGAYLFIGILILAWWIILGVYSSFNPDIVYWGFLLNSFFGKLLILAWTLALFYHLLNGIRHLFWDMGKGFEIKTMNRTGILVLLLTIVLTFVSWGIAMNQ